MSDKFKEALHEQVAEIVGPIIDERLAEVIRAIGIRPVGDESSGELLTAEQAAKTLQINKQHIYRLARENKLKCVWLGENTVRFEASALKEFIEQGGVRSKPTLKKVS